MATSTAPVPVHAWNKEEVRAVLAEYGREPQQLTVEQMRSWWFNLVLRVEADGERLVLRRYGITPPEEVLWEIALLQHLRSHQFPAISPLPRRDGRALSEFGGRPAILYSYIEGYDGCHPSLDPLEAMGQTATLIARMHDLTEGLSLPYPRQQSGADSRRMVSEFLQFVRERGVATHEHELDRFVETVERYRDDFTARVAAHEATLRRGIIHHDAHCRNVLFHDGQLVALMDFDDACEGFLVADLAVMLGNWAYAADGPSVPTSGTGASSGTISAGVTGPSSGAQGVAGRGGAEHGVVRPDYAAHLVHVYQQHHPLSDAERELLPDFLVMFLLGDCAAQVQQELDRGHPPSKVIPTQDRYQRVRVLFDASPTNWRDSLRRQLLPMA